jgi:hypothetical protein
MQLYSQDIINFMSIGIGVTNPISKFHVNGIITAPQINSTDDLNLLSTGTTNNIKIRTNSSTVGKGVIFESGIGEVMRIQANNGFIGIGTTNAQSLLHLHNNNQSGIVQINLTNGSSGAANTDGFAIIKNGNEDCFVWNYENTNLSFATNNLERIKILAGGNVGIGTSTISEKLHVSGNLLVSGNDSSSGNITAGKSVTTPIITSGTGNTSLTIKTETTNDIIFQTNNSEQMRYVHSTQRLGIGSAIPLQRLDLGNGNIRLNEIFKMDTNISNIFVTSNALKNLQNLVNYNNINGIPIISDPVYLDPNNKLTLKLDNPFIIADNSDPTKTGKLQLNLDTSTLQINADGTVGVVNVILNRTQTSNLFTTKTESNLIWNALEYAGVWTINNTNNIYNRLSGNVGIGSTTPTEKLTVNGNILASGNITGNGLSGNINNNLNVNSFNNMLFNINSIERMRINIPQYLPYLSYNLNNNLNYSGTDTNFNLIYSSPTTPIYLSINNITGIYINNISATNYIYINNSFINSRYINNTFTLKFSINYPSINGFNICFGLNNNSGSVNYFELGSTINQDNTINYWISYVVTSGSLANKFYFSIAIPIIRINVWHDLIYVKYLDVITKTYKIDLFINNIKQTTLDIPEFNVTANILTIGATYTGGTPLFNQNTQITDAIFTNLQLYSQDLINFINVGIGVNNPSSKLHVNGTITAPQINSIGDLNLSSSGTTNNITIKTNTLTPGKGIIFESGIGEVMRIQTNDGNVGIGSSASLVDKLTVIGNIRSSGRIITSEIASTGDLTIIPNNTNTNSIIFKSGTASLERMRIFPSGFVGIGTTERVNLSLYVVGDILSTASLIAPTLMNSNNNDLKIRNITNTNIIFENGSSSLEFMRITSDGKVGIGSSVPRDKLDLGAGNLLTSGTITTANITTSTITTGANVSDLIIKNLSDNKNIVFQTTSGSSERMKILSSGNVGIGVTLDANITSRLTVAGTARITVSPDQTGGTLVVDNSITTSNINNNTNNLKIRTTTANDIIFETGSSSIEYMRITSGGRVGIGSSVPTAMLDLGSGSLTTTGIITGNLNLTGDLDVGKVKNTKNNSDFKISNIFANTNIIFEIGGSSTEYMRITSAGRVGIGSSVPQERLDLGNGNLLTSGTIKTSSIISPNITTGANVSDLEIKTEGDKGIIFKTGSGSTEKMQIFSGGNVGIGTTNNPLVKLYVVGSIRAATDTNTSIANIRADTSLISPILTAGTTGIGTSLFIRTETDNDVIFHTGSTLTEKMRLRFDGNLGIGTSIPTSKLQVFGDISSTGTGNITATSSVKTPLITTDDNLLLRSLTTNKDIIFQTTATINSAIITSERMRILSSGNVGIGVTLNSSITSTLTVGGTARITVSPVDQTGGTLLVDNSITTSSINNNTNNLKIRTTTANDIIFETGLNSIEYMRITSGGRVGIGSSVPKEALDLGSANIITSGNITGNIISTGGAFSSNLTTGSIINSTSNIIFNIGSFERMRINLPISLNNFYWSFNGNLNNSGSYSTGSTSFIVQSGTSASYSSGNSGIIINNSANPSTSSYIYLNTVSGIANTYFNQNFTFAFSINYIGNGFNICFGTRTTNSYTFFELGSTITVNIISYWINYFNGTSVNKVNFATNIPFSLNTWYNLMYIKYKDSFTGNYKIDLYINNIKQITLDIPNIIVSSDGIAIGSSIILVSSSSITVATIANLTQTTNAIFSNMSLFQDDLLNITNVGIGITNPSSKLHVNGSITAPQLISSSNLTLTANSLTTPADIIFFTNTSEKMRIYSSGNVGIGTTREPSVRLFVGGNFTSSGLILGSNLSTDRLFNNNNLNIETSDVKDIIFSTITSAGNSITEKVRIFANGNVGIGSSTTFSSKLYVVGDITTTGTLITNTSIITPVITTGAVTRDLIIKTDTVNDIIFSTVTSGTSSSSEKLRILSGGNIGIGTSTNVNTKLYIYGDTTTTGNLYANTSVITPKITTASTLAIETSGASDITFASKNSSQSAVSEKMRITSLGNVGIGITSSINDKLHVVGSIKTTTSLTADTSVITPTLTTNGLLTISTTGTNTNILFSTNGTTTPASRNAMTIFSNGGVGIGVTTLTNSVSLDVAGTVKATTFSGNLTGNVTGNCSGSSGSCTGNAATANNLVNGNFSFNAGTGTISATTFVGNVTGNCSGSSGSCTGNAATANNLVNGNFSFSAGTGTITARTFSGNLNGTVNGIDVTSSKNLNPLIDVWHNSTDNRNRFYFANGGRTYFGSGNGYEWRNSADNQIMILENNGALSCTHITIPSGGVINFGEGDGRIYRTGGNVYIESDDIIYFKTAGSIITFNSGTANFPGMITGNITGNAGGLTGTPAITVQDITCRTINSSSSITLDGEIRNARWRLMNDPDNWCRLYRRDSDTYYNFAANEIYAASTIHGSITGRADNARYADSANYANSAGSAGGIYGNPNVDLNALYCSGTRYGGTRSDTGYWFTGSSSTGTNYTRWNYSYGLIVEQDLWVRGGFWLTSDERIKKNIQDIKDDNALRIILDIEPKTFEYIDFVKHGSQKEYGFISQQIDKIIPEAIKKHEGYIPNIFKLLELNKNQIIFDKDITNDFKINDSLQLIDEKNNNIFHNIINIDKNIITIDTILENNKIFVYGKKVEDFHTIDKTYIFTLNVCATQELHRIIQSQKEIIDSHEKRISDLEEKINRLINSNI